MTELSNISKASPAMQDYLKQIYLLEQSEGVTVVGVGTLADRLGVSAASATNMLKRLAGLGFVIHRAYQGAELTASGRDVALEMVRHHRLLETYLAEALGVPWDRVHAEAEVLEHFLSEDLEERIASVLGHPDVDPHGHPIPARDLSVPADSSRVLWESGQGAQVEVVRVSDSEPEALRFLASVGIKPGTKLSIDDRGPVGGPLFVTVEGSKETQALSKELSEAVWVR